MLNRDSILKSIKILLFFFASSVSLSHKISHAGVVTGHAVQCWQADICGLYCTVLLQAQVLSLVVMCSVGKLQAPVVCTVLLQAQLSSLVVMCSMGKLTSVVCTVLYCTVASTGVVTGGDVQCWQAGAYGTGSPDWNVLMVDIHL